MKLTSYWHKLKSIFGLSLSLAKANFKLRNEGSYLGIFWYLLEPLLMFGIILLVTQGTRLSEIQNYPIYLLIGLIIFNFFSNTTLISSDTIKNNADFIRSIKINYESLVLANIIQFILSHIFEIVVLIIFMIIFKTSLIGLIFYPLVFILLILFVSGASFILATIGTYVRDIRNVWAVLIRILWFATPIFYVLDKSSLLYKLSLFNPIFYFIEVSRNFIIYTEEFNFFNFNIMVGISVLSFIIGLLIFNKYKHRFAEAI